MRKAVIVPVLGGLAMLASCDAASAPPAKSSEVAGATGARVKRIVAEQLGIEPARVTSRARFFQDLGADAAAERMATVGDVVAWLEANRR
jgi:hypothetical protein